MKDYYGVIYQAKNVINNKIYIGQTVSDLKLRKAQHYSDKRKYHFHNALHKYKKEDFIWKIIDKANSIEELNKKEVYWITYYNSAIRGQGYNHSSGGTQGGKMSKETRQKISDAKKKYIFTEEHKKNISIKTKEAMADKELRKELSNKKIAFWKNLSNEDYERLCKKRKGINKGIKKPKRSLEHEKNCILANKKSAEKKKKKIYKFLCSLNKEELINLYKNTKNKSNLKKFFDEKYGTKSERIALKTIKSFIENLIKAE